MTEPKLFIESEKELHDLLKYWQNALFLSDWFIGISFQDPSGMQLKDVAGESDVQWVNRCGTIAILEKEYIPDDLILKQPQEETLIHELLHFKFISFEEKTREEAFYDIKQHQLLQDIARSLFMAKYGITRDWYIKNGC